MEIRAVKATEILDSRGFPTVEVTISTAQNSATASVPSGASKGVHEALEKRDGGKRYLGKGVRHAIEAINDIFRHALIGESCLEQNKIDKHLCLLDGTQNKSKYGSNAILAVSMAVCRLASYEEGVPLYKYIESISETRSRLPHPFFNIINGGKHAGNDLSIQEFMIVPQKASSFHESLQMASETYHALKEILLQKYGKSAINVGDEGGFAPPISTPEQALDLLTKATDAAGYSKQMRFAIDCASSEWFRNGNYHMNNKILTDDQLLSYYEKLTTDYPLISIEDPFHQEDFTSHATLRKLLPETVQIVGDDLLATHPDRIKTAIISESVNCLLLKLNQIGTVSEALKSFSLARSANWATMVSHRSGETNDTFIADLATGLGCGQIKAGAPCRGERIAKYNRLLAIETELTS